MKKKGLSARCELEHVGFSVPNLIEAVDFFENIIGAELVCCREVLVAGGDIAAGDKPRLCRVAIFDCDNGCSLELMQGPDDDTFKSLSAPCAHHLAFFVDDIDKAVGYLKARGVAVTGGAEVIAQGARKGMERAFFRAPWGMQLELITSQKM